MDPLLAPLNLEPSETAAVRAWQQQGTAYQDVQALLRAPGFLEPDGARLRAAEELAESLDVLISRRRLRRETILYRGIRDLSHVVELNPGVEDTHRVTLSGFVASSLDVRATLEFIPTKGGVLMLSAPVGTPALDVARYGDPRLARQQEILLRDGTLIEIEGRTVGRTISTDRALADRVVFKARIIL